MEADRDLARFGKYELLEKIGSGGMAEIFKARLRGIAGFEKVLVLKRILPSYAENKAFVTMLVDEANVCAALQHPNIVQTFELGEVDDQPYIAMEFVQGRDLRQLMKRLNRLRQRSIQVTHLPLALFLGKFCNKNQII